jgi:hypothetical protein
VALACSEPGGAGGSLTVRNETPDPVALFWVGEDCLEQFYEGLEPGEEVVHAPSERTAWTVRDPETAELLERVELPGPEDVTVVVSP